MEHQAVTVAVSNQKGGVGKTTTVVNLAAFCALGGKRTLVVDCDPQGNASSVLAPSGEHGSVFAGQEPLPTSEAGLSIIPAGQDLLEHERTLAGEPGGRQALRRALAGLRDRFDLILIDCPPSLALLPNNALLAADALLIPIQCEYFAMEGLSQLLAHVHQARQDEGRELPLAGIVLTMHDQRLPLSRQVAGEIRKHFGETVFRTAIPRDIALAAAPSYSKTILDHDPLSPGGLAYLALAKEFLDGLR